MEVNCRGCAGCCLDWRPLAPVEDHERLGPHRPLDDVYNLVPLSRDDVWALLDAGYAQAMTPRLWEATAGPSVTIGGHQLAAIEGKPAFFVGLRKVPKPVAPFESAPAWLPTCIFLDPESLQCRIHEDDHYPEECAAYPGHNLSMGAETECERVESHFGGERLLEDTPPDGVPGPLFGPQAVGQKVFVYPHPDELEAKIARIVSGELTAADRARFVAAAAASAPGTDAVEPGRFESALETIESSESWIGRAIDDWETYAGNDRDPDPGLGTEVEDARGAPETPGWD